MKKIAVVLVLICFGFTGQAQPIAKVKMTDVVQLFNNKSDTIYVVNFWASFCKPCVAEIPDFIKITNKYKGQKVKLLLVSLDLPSYYPAKIAAFAKQYHFDTHHAWLNETDADYFCPMIDSNWSGTIPATIIVNAKTGYKKFWEGDVKGAFFEGELKKAISDSKIATAKKMTSPMYDAKVLNRSMEDNSGFGNITFTSKDSTVFAVSSGVVISVVLVEDIKVVIVERDNLYYTYSNLKTTTVKKGDTISADQIIGYAAHNLDGIIAVDFYLNNQKGAIALNKDDFKMRQNVNSIYFTPMLGLEPE